MIKPSVESRLFYYLLRFINKKKFLEMQFAFGRFDFYNCNEPPKETEKTCKVTRSVVDGHNVFTLSPKKHTPSATHILYLHGGAYVQNFVKQHWRFLSMIVKETNCTITAPDYPLAPRYNYKTAFTMLSLLYEQILGSVQPHNIILMGDSAGGGLALALAQKLRMDSLSPPGQLILLSPWLDITLTNPTIPEIDRIDPFLSVPGLRKAGLAYGGESGAHDSVLSPVNGELEDIGRISIFIGTHDLLVADTRKLKILAEAKRVSVNYREYPGMVHVWMFLSFPEAKRAQKEILDLILDSD